MATSSVIFDLFGTLVVAPSTSDRSAAAAALADATATSQAAVEAYLESSWQVRHDGTLPSTDALAAHLMIGVGSRRPLAPVVEVLERLATSRLEPDPSVTAMLARLHNAGLRIGLVSDAAAEVATAWPRSALAPHIDHAVFSCTAGVVKPAANLYQSSLHALNAVPHQTVYIGDGGGDELRGAETLGIRAVCVNRRGGERTLAYGVGPNWSGPRIDSVDNIQPDALDALGLDRSRTWRRLR